MSDADLKSSIEAAYQDRKLLEKPEYKAAVEAVVAKLDAGELRVAMLCGTGDWETHAWLKQAVLLYFAISEMVPSDAGPLHFYDKIPIKSGLDRARVRVVPPGTIRYGAFVEPGAIVMPGYVNIGAYVGQGTMVDTWATVGSCAQIGRRCHLSGGVGIGGVLEPPGAQPVIVEDDCFIGSRAIIVEGVLVEREAVIGAAVTLTASTPIVDVSGSEPKEYRGRVPSRSVVIPGMRAKRFPAGEFMVPTALIIGKRKESTDQKTSLNDALRDFGVAV
jgi:2,3,4,5-tetrahydropyridine-2-carboxylate N-succinyltransferase